MNNTELQHLINGDNIARFFNPVTAERHLNSQPYYTCLILGSGEHYWVPSTPAVARQLLAAGYQEASTARSYRLRCEQEEEEGCRLTRH